MCSRSGTKLITANQTSIEFNWRIFKYVQIFQCDTWPAEACLETGSCDLGNVCGVCQLCVQRRWECWRFVRQTPKLAQPVTDSSLQFYRCLLVCAADAELLQLSKTTTVHSNTTMPTCTKISHVYRSIRDFHLHAGRVREINSLDSLDLAKLKHCVLLKLQHFRANKLVLYSYRWMSP